MIDMLDLRASSQMLAGKETALYTPLVNSWMHSNMERAVPVPLGLSTAGKHPPSDHSSIPPDHNTTLPDPRSRPLTQHHTGTPTGSFQ